MHKLPFLLSPLSLPSQSDALFSLSLTDLGSLSLPSFLLSPSDTHFSFSPHKFTATFFFFLSFLFLSQCHESMFSQLVLLSVFFFLFYFYLTCVFSIPLTNSALLSFLSIFHPCHYSHSFPFCSLFSFVCLINAIIFLSCKLMQFSFFLLRETRAFPFFLTFPFLPSFFSSSFFHQLINFSFSFPSITKACVSLFFLTDSSLH